MHPPMKVLLTGGTGFLGEYLLAELLERGHSVWALYRNESKKLDTIRFLSSLGLPRSAETLHWCRGDLLQADSQWDDWCKQNEGLEQVDTLLHSAASTKFHLDESGEPLKTNLGGCKALLELVEKKPMQAHLISTAFVCGLIKGETVYEVNHARGDFLNVYEETKWEAEQMWEGKATILRPSVIIGHSETGRCTSFTGWYVILQATQLLGRLLGDGPGSNRHNLGLSCPAKPDGTLNLIPVDYVAKAAIRIIEDPANHNKIFHLTHPEPPTHEWTLELISRKFDIGGITFAGWDAPFTQPRNKAERMTWRHMQSILFYFSNEPIFDRTNTDRATPDLPVPRITNDVADRLVAYAIDRDWGHAPQ